jgi:hypothetical protein
MFCGRVGMPSRKRRKRYPTRCMSMVITTTEAVIMGPITSKRAVPLWSGCAGIFSDRDDRTFQVDRR